MPFDAAIIQRDFTSIYDKALVLGGCSYLRPLTYGNGWSRIRLGALVGATPNGVANISDMAFTLGLCAGQTNPGSANLPANAFGASLIGSYSVGATRLLTYTANTGFPYFSPTAGTIYRRQGTTTINSAALSASFLLPLAYTGTQKRRFPVIVDITRTLGGSGLATVTVYGVTTGALAQLDYRPDDLQSALDQVGTPTVRNTALVAATAISTVPIGDEFGGLDTFELFWSNSTFPLEIYALGAVVINPMIGIPATGSITTTYVDMGGGADNMTQYTPGVQYTSSAFGTGFSSAGTVYGYSYGTTVVNLLGTSGGVPMDNFEQYLTGTVISNVTLNAGTGWSGNAFIY